MTLTELNQLNKEDLMLMVLDKHHQVEHRNTMLNQKEDTIQHLQHEIDHLRSILLNAQRDRFGKSSERDDSDGEQLAIWADLQTETPPSTQAETETISYTRNKIRKARDLSHLPHRDVPVNVPDDERLCGCGKEMNRIGIETSKKLHMVPQVLEVVVFQCEVIACPCKGENSIRTAKMPKTAFPGLMVTEESLANLAVNKVLNRQPLYHQAEQYARKFNVDISRQTLARWFIRIAEVVTPLTNLLKDEILKYDILFMDSTGFQVLNEPGRKAETESQAYCFIGGPPDKRVISYEYTPNDHKEILTDLMSVFKGLVHCDAAVWYKFLENPDLYPCLILAYCHAHLRRKFEKLSKRNKPPGLAKEVIAIYKAIYKQERIAKDQKLTPDERKAFREEHVRPLMDKLKTRLDAHVHLVGSNTELGKAVAYGLRRWDGFLTFFNDGRMEIDNNYTEQKIKDFVMARKNFMFADTQVGADAVATLFTLIITAEIHGANVEKYLTHVLKEIPNHSISNLEKLLPWNVTY